MKRFKIALACAATAALGLLLRELAAPRVPLPPPGTPARLAVVLEPRAEPVYCLLNLGPWAEVNAYAPHPLRAACRERFATAGPAELARSLAAAGDWDGERAARFALASSSGGGRLAAAARSFADGEFAAFAREREEDYARILSEARENLPHPDPGWLLEDYFGFRAADGYRLALSPLLPPDLGSDAVALSSGAERLLYQFVGPFLDPRDPRRATFADKSELFELTIHEFGHEFIGRALAGREGLFAGSERLLAPVRGRLDPEAYGGWRGLRDEYLTHVLEHRIALRLGDKRRARALAREFALAGFDLLPYLSEAFAEYERARARYPDFRAFVPRLAERLAAVSVEARPGPRPLGVRWRWAGGRAVAVSAAPGLAFAAAGGRAGDALLKADGRRIKDTESLLKALARYEALGAGARWRLSVEREGVAFELELVVAHEPRAYYTLP